MIIETLNTPYTRVTDYFKQCKTIEEINKVGDVLKDDIEYLKENDNKCLETTFKWYRVKLIKEYNNDKSKF